MRGKRSSAARAVGDYFVSLIQQSIVPDLLQRPPFGLDKVVVVCYIRVVHVRPEADGRGEVLPHALVFPYAFLTFLYERLKTVALDLILAVDAELFLDLKLNGQSVCVPARLTDYLCALHRMVARYHVLYNSCENMTDMRLAVCCRRTVIECVNRTCRAGRDTLFEDIVVLPELFDVLLALHEIQVRVDLFIGAHKNTS